MHALALKIANDVDGYLVGDYPISFVIQGFPYKMICVLGQRPWQPAKGEDSGRIEYSVTDGFFIRWRIHASGRICVGYIEKLDRGSMVESRKCWFTKDGRLMQTDEMRRIVETKTFDNQHDETLNTMLKFEQCGIRVDKVSSAFYEPSILPLCESRGIKRLLVAGIRTTDDLSRSFARYEFDTIHFYGCEVYARIVHAKVLIAYSACNVVGTFATCFVNASSISGYVASKCKFGGVLHDHYVGFRDSAPRSTIEEDEKHERMCLRVRFLAELPVSERAYKFAKTIDVDDFKKDAIPHEYYVVMTKYQSIFKRNHNSTQLRRDTETQEILIKAKLTIPMEWIVFLEDLIYLSSIGLAKPRHPFFAQLMHLCGFNPDLSVFNGPPPNNIATFLKDTEPWARECPRYPTRCANAEIRMVLPLDQIKDMINRHGFTPEMMDMLVDQIIVFNGMCSKLRKYLRGRRDTPPYLLTLFD